MMALDEVYTLLRDRWGLEFDRVRAVVHALGSGATVDELVARCEVSQRAIAEILDHLQPFVCHDGDQIRLTCAARDPAAALFGVPRDRRDPWGELARQHPALPRMVADLQRRPVPNRHLDHVAATAVTVVKRALFLSHRFDLAGANVLMMGDHDMTALALAYVEPNVDIAVVDMDERVLAFVDDVRRRREWPIEPHFADLRLELPRSLVGRFDLVFTDPPYTEPGMKLFLLRSIQALNERAFSRIGCAYGVGEQQVALGFKVQTVLNELRLVIEAIEPGFNQYEHAPALGNRSDLYLLRPTRRSSAAAKRWTGTGNIYTRGHGAEESPSPAIPPPLIDRLGRFAAGAEHSLAVAADQKQLSAVPATERLTLATYLTSNNLGRCRQTVIASLYPNHADYLARLCLRSQAADLAICAAQRAVADLFAHQSALRKLIDSRFELGDRQQQGNVGAVFLTRRFVNDVDDDVVHVLHGIFARPKARLINAWRESLIAWSKTQGGVLTKNEARRIISASSLAAYYPSNAIADLPGIALTRLLDDVATSIASVRR